MNNRGSLPHRMDAPDCQGHNGQIDRQTDRQTDCRFHEFRGA